MFTCDSCKHWSRPDGRLEGRLNEREGVCRRIAQEQLQSPSGTAVATHSEPGVLRLLGTTGAVLVTDAAFYCQLFELQPRQRRAERAPR